MLSHELRTPLTPILATVDALERNPTREDHLAAALALIRRNVELEKRLIDDLLDMTRIEHGKLSLHREVVDLHALLEQVTNDARMLSGSRSLVLERSLRARKHYVGGDAARLQQVFWNLVGNSLKFTPPGGEVSISTRDRDGYVEVAVRDTGPGIPPEQLESLFLPFQSGSDPGAGHSGLGLGLAICKALVTEHGGDIEAPREPREGGATFRVVLPAVDRPARTARRRHPRRSRSPTRSLLLVEDHGDTADALATVLRQEGFEVTVAHSVNDALAHAGPQHEMLISDVALPDGSGLDLLRRLRERGLDLSGVVLSGFGADEDIERSRQAGFEAHLVKPVRVQELLEVVRRAAP